MRSCMLNWSPCGIRSLRDERETAEYLVECLLEGEQGQGGLECFAADVVSHLHQGGRFVLLAVVQLLLWRLRSQLRLFRTLHLSLRIMQLVCAH